MKQSPSKMDSATPASANSAPGAGFSFDDGLSVIGQSTASPRKRRVTGRIANANSDVEPGIVSTVASGPGPMGAVSRRGYYLGVDLLTATLQSVLEAIWKAATNQSTVTNVCPIGQTSHTTFVLEPHNPFVSDPANQGRTPRINKGRTPGTFLRDTSAKLIYAATEFRGLAKWERESYKFASAVISAVREGCSDPYTVVSSRWRGTLPIYPPKPALPFRGTPEQFFAALDARLSAPVTFEGRTAAEILDRIYSFLDREGKDPRRGPQDRLLFNSYRAAFLLVKSAQLIPQEIIRTEPAAMLPFTNPKESSTHNALQANSVSGDPQAKARENRSTAVHRSA